MRYFRRSGGSFRIVGLNYMLYNGLAAYAESNDMVILHPQCASNRPGSDQAEGSGCWNWYGGFDPLMDTKTGVQLRTMHNMVLGLGDILSAHADD